MMFQGQCYRWPNLWWRLPAKSVFWLLDNLGNSHLLQSFLGGGNGTPLQCSCLEDPMDGGALWAAVHGVARSWTWLRDFTFTFHFHALEKEMATHSSLAWRIPGTGEPGGLPSMGSHRVGHDWSDLAAPAAAIISKRFQHSGSSSAFYVVNILQFSSMVLDTSGSLSTLLPCTRHNRFWPSDERRAR